MNIALQQYWDQTLYAREREIWGSGPSQVAKLEIAYLDSLNLADKRLLDMGCGYGRDAVYFSDNAYVVYGIDFSEEALKIARSKQSRVIYRLGDVMQTGFKDAFFNIVICNSVLQWFDREDIKKTIDEAYRITADNGTVIIAIPELDCDEDDCIFIYNNTKYCRRDAVNDLSSFQNSSFHTIVENHSHGNEHQHIVHVMIAKK